MLGIIISPWIDLSGNALLFRSL